MSAPLPCEILIETVVEAGLCARCGTCVGACPAGNLSITDPTGSCLPEAGDRCISCGTCLDACPGGAVQFRPHEQDISGDGIYSPLLGVVRSSYLAHAVDTGIRGAGSSGGVVTALLLNLVGCGEVDGALLFAKDEKEPLRGWGRIVDDEKGIRGAAQSRYHLSPMNTALEEINQREGMFAYVGLPCHVHGLRKLESAGWSPRGSIDPVIGIYCGNNLYFEATRAMLAKLGVRHLDNVASLSYREGHWPGFFSVKTKDGRIRRISKLGFNQAITFYVNRRCLFCIDLTNELADISIGDGWGKEGSNDGGWAVVLVRTERGERLLRGALESKAVHTEEISIAEAEKMHAHGFDLKKKGAFIRLKLWKKFGVPVPSYDRDFPAVSAARKVWELVVSLQFLICSTRFGRFVFGLLPAGLLGSLFRGLRRIWIDITRRGSG